MPQKSTTKIYTHYHKDGSVWAKGTMNGKKMVGYWEWYRKDGTKMRSGNFEKGRQTGEWITYDAKGKIHRITDMTPKQPKNRRVCSKGHVYFKTTSCPVCPICEKNRKPKEGFLSLVSAPARRALEGAKLTSLKKLSKVSEAKLLQLHGIGPAALPPLRRALKKEGLSFLI